MKNALTLIVVVLVIITAGCTKINLDDTDKDYPIELTGTVEGLQTQLSWTPTNVSTFEEYLVVRTTEEVEGDDFLNFQFNVIARISDFDENTFVDTLLPINEELYYKVFVDIGDRFIVSPTIKLTQERVILSLRATQIAHYPEKNSFLIFDALSGSVNRYDYVRDSMMSVAWLNSWNARMSIGQNNSNTEVYIVKNNGSSIDIHDANTLNYKRSIFSNYDVYKVTSNNNGKLIVSSEEPSKPIKILQATDGTLLSSANNSNSFESRTNALINNSPNEFIEASSSGIHHYTLNPFDGSIQNHQFAPLSFADLSSEIIVSPDGQYFTGHNDGSFYDKNLNLIDRIGGNDFTDLYIDFAFTEDGTRVFALSSFRGIVEEYSFPELKLLGSYSSGTSPRRIFVKGNDLYLIGEGFINFTTRTVIDKIPI